MKVVLLGYMASGKSSVGRALAKRLDLSFLDLDEEISKAVEMDIPEIFLRKGEIFFRKKEAEVLKEVLMHPPNMVLSVGGGTPCYGRNMELIDQLSDRSYYLKLSIGNLVQRIIQEREHRPLVKNIPEADLPEFIGKHLFERSPFYALAKQTIATDQKTLDEVVQEIVDDLV